MIYLILALYLFFLVCRYDLGKNNKGRKFHFWLAYVFLVSLVSFRYHVGGDTINYIIQFENSTPEIYALELFANSKLQPIPAIIFAVCKTFFDDFVYVQIIFAVFVNTVFFWFFKNNTQYFFTALFLYALTFYMRLNCEIMRESLAIAFFLLSYPYLIKRKYIKYYLFATLALLCHSSAIFIFALPLFFSFSKKKGSFVLLAIVAIIALIILSNTSLIGNIISYSEAYSDYKSSIWGKLSIVIFNILIPGYFFYISRHYLSDYIKKGVTVYLGCSFLSLFVYIAYRFNNYLMIFYILMVSECLVHFWENKRIQSRLINIAVMAFVFLFSFMDPYFTDVSKYVGHNARWYCVWYPYYSVFNPQIDQDRETFINNQRDF